MFEQLGNTVKGLMSGENTPWAAMQTGAPTRKPSKAYITDPNAISTGFDYSPLKAAYQKAIKSRSAQGNEQALASLTRAGVQGADTSRALTDLAWQRESDLADLDANMALKEWQDRLGMMDRLNRIAEAENQAAADEYYTDLARRDAETAGRQAWGGKLLMPMGQFGMGLAGSALQKKTGA